MVLKMDLMSPSRTAITSAILFLSLSTGVLTFKHLSADVIFKDLIHRNAICWIQDSCKARRFSDYPGDCHCDRKCAFLGTCCLDSNYRTPLNGLGFGFSCVNVNPFLKGYTSVFLLDTCKRKIYGDDVLQDLCLRSAEELDDPLLLVPVISTSTGITYKNYFCFACNEGLNSVKPVFWEVEILSDYYEIDIRSGYPPEVSLRNLHFDKDRGTWTLIGRGDCVVMVKIPKGFEKSVIRCVDDIIHTCDENWTDVETEERCHSYMAIVWREGSQEGYRNPHCAICNYEDPAKLKCEPGISTGGVLPALIGQFYLSLENRCTRNMMFDPISKKCRVVMCGANQRWYYGECRDYS